MMLQRLFSHSHKEHSFKPLDMIFKCTSLKQLSSVFRKQRKTGLG